MFVEKLRDCEVEIMLISELITNNDYEISKG